MTQPYSVFIDGQSVFVEAGTLTIDKAVGQRSTAQFLLYSDQVTHYEQAQQVSIYDQNNVLTFSGYINQPQEQMQGFQPQLEVQVQCMDQHYLADKRVVAATFQNRSRSYIVAYLLNNILATEGVTLGAIFDEGAAYGTLYPNTSLDPNTTLYPKGDFDIGVTPNVVFAYCTVAAALDSLTAAASYGGIPYYWMIDENKKLWWVPYTYVTNSTLVDGTQIEYINNPCYVIRTNPAYRNTQYLIGGVAQTLQQTETRSGDSHATAFTMSYDLASKPTLTVNPGSVNQTVGVKGVSSGTQWYWAQGDPVISQDSSQPVLTSSQTLTAVYYGQYPNVILTQNVPQIQYAQALDGTTGIIEVVDTDPTIVDATTGYAYASQLLTRYAQQGVQIQFTTLTSGFAPGQLITVNLPQHGLYNASMLIEHVIASDQTDSYNIWYTVYAVAGPYDVTWADFFIKMYAASQPSNSINVGVSNTLTILQDFTHTITASGTLNTNVYSCPVPNTSLHPNTTLYPC